jgi:cobalt-zinc-cadmium efflux system membrane fusion protein
MNKLSILAFLVLFASCQSTNKENPENSVQVESQTVTLNDIQVKNAGIAIGKLEKKTLSRILNVNGKIDVPPQNMVSVSVPLGGYLKSTQLLPGMHIRKGEVIAVMEDQQYIQLQQDFLVTQAKLNYTEKEFERQKELNQSKATSDKVFQQAESDYKTQKITLKSLGEKLKLIGIQPEKLSENTISKSINLYSPIDGYVTHVNVNIGKYTQPSEVLFELVNPADIHLALTIFEKDLDDIFIGQKLIAYNNRNPEKKHVCEIILVGKNLTADRNAEVHCHFDKYDETLIPGMFMNAEINLKSIDTDVLPDDAIVSFEGHQYVFAQDKTNQFTLTEVETGSNESGFTQIINASQIIGKSIVVKGAYTLLMQMKNTADE